MPSIPCLPFHFRVISHPGCLRGRQCIMEGACFTFDSDELLTRAKNQSATHVTGRGFVQANVAHPEGYLPQTGAEITAISCVLQVCLPFTVQTVYINDPHYSCCEYGMLLTATCQVFTWFATHDRDSRSYITVTSPLPALPRKHQLSA